MKYDKVTIIGVAICVLSFFGIMWMQSRRAMQLREMAAEQERLAQAQAATEAATQAQTAETTPAANAATPSENAPAVANPPAANTVAATPATDGQTVTPFGPDIPRPFMDANTLVSLQRGDEQIFRIDPALGGIVGVELLKYSKEKTKNPEDAVHVNLGNFDYPYMALNSRTMASLGLGAAKPETDVVKGDGFVEISRVNAAGDLKITERWSIESERSYEIDYTVSVTNLGTASREISNLMIDGGVLPHSVSGRKEDGGGAAYMPLDKNHATVIDPKTLLKLSENYAIVQNPNALEGEKLKSLERINKTLNGRVIWGGIHSKYFLMSIWNQGTEGFARFDAFGCNGTDDMGAKPGDRSRGKLLLNPANLEPGATTVWKLRGYAGPKDTELLHAMGNGMDGIMGMDRFFWGNFAWMGWISRMLLKCLVWFSKIIPGGSGYGWGVIALTVAVKLLFWPLSHKSTQSMRKMQELKPQLDAIKEKYRDDPRLMYEKQQELMKANNVSQLGGCLPMLFQIPVFFALFNTFRSAIELRHAGFLWAADLSMPDTVFAIGNIGINPLAILMGLTMVLQQKMTPSADAQQSRMMMFMSIFFIWIFYAMPSALTLYMTVNQLLSILQTYMGKRADKAKAPKAA
ncbi:MAG: YidC/Oxa1 family insertase periplasmic-domain containing protein [Victivallales bacterium]|nr:YidC/Oxa1 family insertase periplasmic-domain containing protein [Victivallales bacterium]